MNKGNNKIVQEFIYESQISTIQHMYANVWAERLSLILTKGILWPDNCRKSLEYIEDLLYAKQSPSLLVEQP